MTKINNHERPVADEDVSDLVTETLDSKAIWAKYNAIGAQAKRQRNATPGEADESTRHEAE